MNLSKFAIAALVTSGLFVACSEEISENTVDTQYTAQTGNIGNAGQAVDLGLPSGTLWANKNVGASSESDNGILFIWGDITGKKIDADKDGTYTNVTEATSMAELYNAFTSGTYDGQVCDTTNIVQTSQAKLIGKAGMTKREKKDAILEFLRAKLDEYKDYSTGDLLEVTLVHDGYWTVLMNPGGDDRIPDLWTYFGYDKLPKEKQPAGVTVEDSLNYYDLYKFEKITSVSIDDIVITKSTCKTTWFHNNYQYNDGYAEVKDAVGKVVYKDYIGGSIGNSIKDITDPKKYGNLTFIPAYYIYADAEHDAATANWGGAWKMPTTAQLAELMNYCTWEFEGSGYRVTGPNGNSIFLPAAGYRYGDKQYGKGNAGYYASGEIIGTYSYPSMAAQNDGSQGEFGSTENMPSVLMFQFGQYNTIGVYNNMSASYGFSIRPVANLLK